MSLLQVNTIRSKTGSSAPNFDRGINVSGVCTLGNLQISSGIVTSKVGILTYYGDGRYLQNLKVENISQVNIGIATITNLVADTGNFFGVVTASKFVGDGSGLTNVSGMSANANINTLGIITASSYNGTNISISGIITAGRFVGDGSGLTGIVATGTGVQVRDNNTVVGTAATINFGNNLDVNLSGGIVTVNSTSNAVSISTTPPPGPIDGDLWYNPKYGRTFIWYNESLVGAGVSSAWVDASPYSLPYYLHQENVGIATQTSFQGKNAIISGIITAGRFVGDGSGLTGIVATGVGVQVRDDNVVVGTAATINFGEELGIQFSSGIATVIYSGNSSATNITNDNSSSSTHYITYVSNLSGYRPQKVSSSSLTFIPSSGTLGVNSINCSGSITASTITVSNMNYNGNFLITGNLDVLGDINSSSDIKLKTNIKPIKNTLDNVKKLNGVSFDWIRDNTPSIGLIAQEVEEVYPSLVQDVNGTKTIKYNSLIAVLVESIKELSKEVEELKNKLENS